jgi:hypothetical protein
MKQLSNALLALMVLVSCNSINNNDADLVLKLMEQKPDQFARIITAKDSSEVQIIYTQIDRDENNNPSFKSYYFNVDSSRYFYPASTIKLPMSLLALEKINELKITGLNKFTPMYHDSAYAGQLSVMQDTTSRNKQPSIAHYIKKVLVVSDNDAYNRLYEFMGQKAANERMRAKGYNPRFLHRLERALSPDKNRHTEKVRFIEDGRVLFEQAMLFNEDSIKPPARIYRGKGFYRDTVLIEQPFEFTYKNFYSLTDQQKVLKAVLFPESVDMESRFNLSEDDYKFIRQYLSQLPSETVFPAYYKDTSYYDAYCKFFIYGAGREKPFDQLRIFNKVGDAYGYLIDNAYVVDFGSGVEFMLSAVISVNTDGIYNDGEYDYDGVGYPFFKHLGRLIYDYELKRPRRNKPDLSKFKLSYDR